ncbi:MAG: F0F1 ATP synthase subunit B [Puniceicoccales bacterium]|jgi:F-type H+-transporting ATPase subunit b|nr:F0F1 ATP synthase subunit B [Puniceicoccales bacterium]
MNTCAAAIHALAAAGTTTGAAAANPAAGILDSFGVSWPTFAASLANFGIVALVLYYFAFRPLLKTLDARNEKIAEGLRFSDEMKAQLADAQKQYEARLDAAAVESAGILRDAAERAKVVSEKAEQDAIAKANGILERAGVQLAQDREKMLAELRGEVAKLVVQTTAKLLSRELTDAEKLRFNTAATNELAQV